MIVLQCQLHPGLNSGPSTSVNWYKNEEIIQRNDPNFHQHSDRQNNVFEIEFNASLITANNTNFSCFIHDNDEDVQCSSNDSSLVILTGKCHD